MPTVLIVDDNPGDRELASCVLEELGETQCWYAGDGREGLAVLRDHLPDVVLTDLRMPQMDGLELVKHIKADHPKLPVILMTSDGSEQIAVEALRQGAASYVSKNSLASHLPATVRQVLAVVHADQHREKLRNRITFREVSFDLSNNPDLIPPLIGYLLDEGDGVFLLDPADRTPIGMALQEALHNSLYHGNLELSSDLRENDIGDYFGLADQRRELEPYKHRRIHLTVRETPSLIEYRIGDDGPGFDPHKVPDPTAPENMERVSGRGLLLIRTFMDEVRFNDRGNEITLVKRARAEVPVP